MPLVTVGVGRIEGPIESKTVGQNNLKVTNFRLNDGQSVHPCEAWGDMVVPPAGTFVQVSGKVRSREIPSKTGNGTFTVTSLTMSSIDVLPVGGQSPAPQAAPVPSAPATSPAAFED